MFLCHFKTKNVHVQVKNCRWLFSFSLVQEKCQAFSISVFLFCQGPFRGCRPFPLFRGGAPNQHSQKELTLPSLPLIKDIFSRLSGPMSVLWRYRSCKHWFQCDSGVKLSALVLLLSPRPRSITHTLQLCALLVLDLTDCLFGTSSLKDRLSRIVFILF